MQEDEEQIRTLIERWAEAVHVGDINRPRGPLRRHRDVRRAAAYDGVRGIDAYRETWPPFFEWQARGASFEIVSLDVTAGDEVAYVHALLRCGTPQELAENPANRLRLTLGLRKELRSMGRRARAPLVPAALTGAWRATCPAGPSASRRPADASNIVHLPMIRGSRCSRQSSLRTATQAAEPY